ncbi:MAG: hypothetical protein GXP63_00135 [DPANN group archaeon]|nr:hypothetical protein [DPANN group archaeon]
MDHEDKVKELAATLKRSGLAASLMEAMERAKAILSVKKPKPEPQQELPTGEKNILAEDKTLQELMDQDAQEVYSKDKERKMPSAETPTETAASRKDAPEEEAHEERPTLTEETGQPRQDASEPVAEQQPAEADHADVQEDRTASQPHRPEHSDGSPDEPIVAIQEDLNEIKEELKAEEETIHEETETRPLTSGVVAEEPVPAEPAAPAVQEAQEDAVPQTQKEPADTQEQEPAMPEAEEPTAEVREEQAAEAGRQDTGESPFIVEEHDAESRRADGQAEQAAEAREDAQIEEELPPSPEPPAGTAAPGLSGTGMAGPEQPAAETDKTEEPFIVRTEEELEEEKAQEHP